MSRYKTPLRYPGGKQRLTPFVRELLVTNRLIGAHYAEPYAGGAGVAIELILAGDVSHIHLNDASRAVYAFWYSILNHTEAFCRLIAAASLTVPEWRRQKAILALQAEADLFDLGFSLFFLNRCNRSGIPSGGVIGGLKQTGKWKIDARFPRNALITRIEAIASKKSQITLTNLDAEEFIKVKVPTLPRKTLVYCDPPYFRPSDRLYLNRYQPEDHARLASTIQARLKRPWIVSYDGVPEVLGLYMERRSFLYDLQYNAARVHKGREVFIFSDKLQIPSSSTVVTINEGLRLRVA